MADLSYNQADMPVTVTDETNMLKINSDGSINVSVGSSAVTNKTYSLSSTQVITPSGSEVNMFLIKNPNGSGKSIKLEMLTFVGNGTIYKFYANPTVTANGTSVTPIATNVGNAVASVANAFSAPTTSARGNRFFSDGAPTQTPSDNDFQQIITIEPNNSILITGIPPANNTSTEFTLLWAEV